MTITNRLKITLTPLRLHSASSVRIPNSINNFRTLIPALRLRPLNLSSASSVNLHGLANTSIFHKRIGYNINIMRQSECLVFNPITVNNFASLFNCTPVGRASDSMMAPR